MEIVSVVSSSQAYLRRVLLMTLRMKLGCF